MVKTFAENDDVMFADVVLSGGGPRGGATASPGAGGWPTIRYYNKGTGADGHNYDKKTDMSMCDELGPKGGNYMQDYVLEAGGTSLCSIEPPYTGCKKKEVAFIEKLATKDAAFVAAQLERLTKMKAEGSKMKPELQDWQNQRIAILEKFSEKGGAGGEKTEL